MKEQAKETAKRKRPPFKIFNKEFSDWLRNSGTNPYVNTNKKGGGRSPND